MRINLKDSRGFSGVEVLLGIVLIILIIGAVGYVLKQQANTKKSDVSLETNTPSQGNFLEIKDWGVRLAVPKGYEGDMYYEKTGENKVDISLKSIVAVAPACAPNKTPLIGGITRNKAGSYDKLSQVEQGQSVSKPFKTIGGYEFAFYHPQAACYDSGTDLTAAYNGRTPISQTEKDTFAKSLEAY